jgi:hypothetical protein
MKVFTNPYPRAKKMSRNLTLLERMGSPNSALHKNPSFPNAFLRNPEATMPGPPIKTFGGDNFGISELAAGEINLKFK